jgi:hypothetical protein
MINKEVTYSIMNASLEETLQVISEMENITGMEPEHILLEDGRAIKYNKSDFKKLRSGGITEEEYIERNYLSMDEY